MRRRLTARQLTRLTNDARLRRLIDTTVAGHEVDALYSAQRLIVELDDYGTHGDTATFQSDRDRDFAHLELGYDTIRLTAERLTEATAASLRRRLAGRDRSTA
jgi:very-short-patch-repair endonuclease